MPKTGSGLSTVVVNAISKYIDNYFKKLTFNFLGLVPKVDEKTKHLIITTKKDSLSSLFMQTINKTNSDFNSLIKPEQRALTNMLKTVNGYIDATRIKTKTEILNELNNYVQDKSNKNLKPKTSEVKNIIKTKLLKTQNYLTTVANAESSKVTNMGTAIKISQIAKAQKVDDPTVFFIVTKDDRTGFYEWVLHLLPDRKTPRLWKLSELKSGYYQAGEQYPSLYGLHPGCRCIVNKYTPVITLYGIKPIYKVTETDLVLTHRGRFRRVLGTLTSKGASCHEPYYIIQYKLPTGQKVNLPITADHPLQTPLGWVCGKDLKKGDLLHSCIETGNKVYSYVYITIDEVRYIPMNIGRTNLRLFDLMVEEDESFIAGGVVNHNCRLTYLAPGWGFDENGKVAFKRLKYNELQLQRLKYGLPHVPSKPNTKLLKKLKKR